MAVIAGPNGAGKSTLYNYRVAPHFKAPFINADLIQRDELKDASVEAAYHAAELAAARRTDYIRDGQSFITETVFSHPSKLTLLEAALSAGFEVMLFHVGVDDPELAVERVKNRVLEGGHPVPEKKIRERFDRNTDLIRQAIRMSHTGFVFDNSALNRPPELVIEFSRGSQRWVASELPAWVQWFYRDFIKRP